MDTQALSSSVPSAIGPDSAPVPPQAAVRTGPALPAEPREATAVDVQTRDPRSLNFQIDKETQKVVVTIVDEDNQLVIRQIPDAEMLRIAREIDRLQGFLLDSKA